MFRQVRGLAIHRNGDVVVYDGEATVIRRFSSDDK